MDNLPYFSDRLLISWAPATIAYFVQSRLNGQRTGEKCGGGIAVGWGDCGVDTYVQAKARKGNEWAGVCWIGWFGACVYILRYTGENEK